ncbi:hypothetical protein BD309DRAFT_960688 [Dichomitus squalens]|uniref:Uncharacterized protein n=1 Tax=Dichomitus squalens TaxID=114155 RepID=A0A4V2K479_9APHY|nr:hypothetical protein BD309DRAFT_960688 [Dichomitus squalens]TBU60842.1 hypothetical protein BD310DRAFT_905129 [Dichomitus squalens]
MSPPVLNHDILLTVMSVSPTSTATSIMATCRDLYHEGAKIVLQHPISLGGPEEKALSLLRFLQAEDLSRCSYVRAFNLIKIDPMPKSVARILVKILPRMSSLERLMIAPEDMLKSYPDLLPAFAAIQSLKQLVMANVGERSIRLIQALQSQLVSATLYFNSNSSRQNMFMSITSHPVQLLKKSASTLQQLTCGQWVDMLPEPLLTVPNIVYPEMRSLTLAENISPNPIPYIRSFPGLTHLTIESHRTDHLGGAFGDFSCIQRQLNLAMQEPDDIVPSSWHHLEHYTGRLVDHWTFGLTCHIHRLTHEDVPGQRAPSALTDVLQSARPSELVKFHGSPFKDVFTSDFLDALRTEGAAHMKGLIVSIDITAEDREIDVARTLTDFETTIVGLRLHHLQCEVRDVGLSNSEETPNEPRPAPGAVAGHYVTSLPRSDTSVLVSGSPEAQSHACAGSVAEESLCTAERTLVAFDVEAFAHRIISAIPTITGMIISIDTPRQCGGGRRIALLGREEEEIPELRTGGEIVYRDLSMADYNAMRRSQEEGPH